MRLKVTMLTSLEVAARMFSVPWRRPSNFWVKQKRAIKQTQMLISNFFYANPGKSCQTREKDFSVAQADESTKSSNCCKMNESSGKLFWFLPGKWHNAQEAPQKKGQTRIFPCRKSLFFQTYEQRHEVFIPKTLLTLRIFLEREWNYDKPKIFIVNCIWKAWRGWKVSKGKPWEVCCQIIYEWKMRIPRGMRKFSQKASSSSHWSAPSWK